jgi:hypothetical protein
MLVLLTAVLALTAFPASAVEIYKTIYGEWVPVENPRLFLVELEPGIGLPGEERSAPPTEIGVTPGDPPILLTNAAAPVAASAPAGAEGGILGTALVGSGSGFGRSPGVALDLRVRQARRALDG